MQHQIQWLKREMYPPSTHSDSAVAGSIQQCISKEGFDVLHYFRMAGWMKPVTAVIYMDSCDFKAARNTSHLFILLNNRNTGEILARELKCRTKTAWACSQYHDMGFDIICRNQE